MRMSAVRETPAFNASERHFVHRSGLRVQSQELPRFQRVQPVGASGCLSRYPLCAVSMEIGPMFGVEKPVAGGVNVRL